jgi:hypothetical protein
MSQNTYIIGLCSPLKLPLEQKILQNKKRTCVTILKFTFILAHLLAIFLFHSHSIYYHDNSRHAYLSETGFLKFPP